jgi:hypothetical protein
MMSQQTSQIIKRINSDLWTVIKTIEDGTEESLKEYIDGLKKANYDFLKKRFGNQSFRDFIEIRSRQPNELQDKFYSILNMLPKARSQYTRSDREFTQDDISTAKHWNHLFNRIVNYADNPDNVHYALMTARIFFPFLYTPMLVKRLIQTKILDIDENNNRYTTPWKPSQTTFRLFYESLIQSDTSDEDIEIKRLINEIVPKQQVKYCEFIIKKGPNAGKMDCKKVVTDSKYCHLHTPREKVVKEEQKEVVNEVEEINNIINIEEQTFQEKVEPTISSLETTVIDHSQIATIDDNITFRSSYEGVNMFIDSDFSDLDFSCSEDERELVTPTQQDTIERFKLSDDDIIEQKEETILNKLELDLKAKEAELRKREIEIIATAAKLEADKLLLDAREAEINKKVVEDKFNTQLAKLQRKSIRRVIVELTKRLETTGNNELIYSGDLSRFLSELAYSCDAEVKK